eukprot:scaffold916_cov516-Prasinococcus_capsulatus_cf.AAC.12
MLGENVAGGAAGPRQTCRARSETLPPSASPPDTSARCARMPAAGGARRHCGAERPRAASRPAYMCARAAPPPSFSPPWAPGAPAQQQPQQQQQW